MLFEQRPFLVFWTLINSIFFQVEVCYSENSQEIQTTNEDPCKTIKGVKCRFPAIYGKTYYSCISSIDESKTWCYTDIEENWDFCDQTTCFACGRNTQNRPCDDGYVGTKIKDDIIIPWFAILVYSYTYKYSVKKPIYVRCGATILNQNWLISSVACFFQNGRKAAFGEMEAIMGTYVVDKIGIPTITTKIKDVVTIEESISLYKLEKPIQHYTSFMSPVCLPSSNFFEKKMATCNYNKNLNSLLVNWDFLYAKLYILKYSPKKISQNKYNFCYCCDSQQQKNIFSR
nr:suppressor of tumorigenicity 14 protein homolog [Lepeophtheirus salmonis]